MATLIVFLCLLGLSICRGTIIVKNEITRSSYAYWPNATIPFYIEPTHFDREQSLYIMGVLATFAFKTCLKFLPVAAAPRGAQHVLALRNPGAERRCRWELDGHSIDEPHVVNLGSECLRSPHMEAAVMRALGFPFEHNRASRDLFIDVQHENIQPDAVQFFSKESKLPPELRNLPYDINSVMHFGERDFSKNGHRTIIIKDRKVTQNRNGLTDTDLRKIEIVYGPECQKRDRQEKIDMCQIYPGVARKKRQAETVEIQEISNLRVNRDITPPPDRNLTNEVADMLKELGIVRNVENIVDNVYKTASVAVENARKKYCNTAKVDLRSTDVLTSNLTNSPTINTIIEAVAKFSQSFVDLAIANLTVFCNSSEDIESYQRIVCNPYSKDSRCPSYYKSTKSGPVVHYTQHRPVHQQSTKHDGKGFKYQYGRSGNVTEQNTNTTGSDRKKREAHEESGNEYKDVDENKLSPRKSKSPSKVLKKTSKKDHLKDVFKRDSKPNLRSATSVVVKRDHYAPFRRTSGRQYRIYSGRNKRIRDGVASGENAKRQKVRHESETEDSERREQRIEVRPTRHSRHRKQRLEDGRSKRLRRVPETVPLSKENKEFYADRKWKKGIIRYVITKYDQYNITDLRSRIKRVGVILARKTCVRLQELDAADQDRYPDYLVLDTSPDYVTGRVGGRQVFGSAELFQGVSHLQHTAMVVMAWLGFYLEPSRHDRDSYVVVHNRHIRPDKLHHFEKLRSDATLPVPYDYSSATQPSWQFWRRIGKTGIAVVATRKDRDPDGSIMRSFGQNPQLLSDLDIIRINSVYGVHCFKKPTRNRMS